MIFRKKQTNHRQNSQIVSEVPELFSSSVMDVSEQGIGEAVPSNKRKRKKEIRRLLISFGLLLAVGASLCFLVPYVKNMASLYFDSAPSILLNVVLLPFFWVLIGRTLMQVFGVVGIVNTNQTKQSRAIHIAVLTLILLYTLTMLPFIIETIKSMILHFQYTQNPDAYPDGFSYRYHIPVFLQKIQFEIISANHKSTIFTVLGVILWICRPDKQKLCR